MLNLVQGEKDTDVALANHRQIDGLFFTGSSETGTLLHRQFGGQPEIVLALEMGGNNPLVVSHHVEDIDAAVHHTIQSVFLSAGQHCTCARHLLVPDDAFGERFTRRLGEVSANIRVGAYDEPQPFMGAVISARAAARLIEAQQRLIAAGATVTLEMRQRAAHLGYVTPAVLDVTHARDVPDEEHFGPLLQVARYRSFDEAIERANDTAYGLSAGLLAADEAAWTHFQRTIRAGIVNWNRPTNGAAAVPFGGVGHSGNQRPSAYYATDYCLYPMASVESAQLQMPVSVSPGLTF